MQRLSSLRALFVRVVELLGLAQVINWVAKLLGWGEHVEFIANRARELGGAGPMISFLVNPPPLFGVLIVVVGLMLIWWDVRRNQAHVAPQVQVIPPAEPPLPTNAKFRYRDKVFWATPRRYPKEEANDMRTALREVYDCINTKSAPIVSNWDGPAVTFTRNWLQVIQKEGRQSAIAKLDDIRSHVRSSYTDLQEILSRRPYYRQDMMSILSDYGESGEMNGALNDYIETLKTLPDNPSVDLIKRVAGQSEPEFENAITKYTNWIASFNTKTLLLKDELEMLMTG
jgi:hypothetical protein